MRHRVKRLQINRFTSWRYATVKSLVRNLLRHQSIRTTKAKARLAKSLADRLITLAKENTLANKRRAYGILGDHRLVSLLFGDIQSRFPNTTGGYTRLVNLGVRRGDNAELAVLELTEIKKKEKKRKKKKEAALPEEAEATGKERPKVETTAQEEKPKTDVAVKEKPPITKKPTKKFLGGLRGIFKKERDSL